MNSRVCPKCGGNTNTYRHPNAKIWCMRCGYVIREEGGVDGRVDVQARHSYEVLLVNGETLDFDGVEIEPEAAGVSRADRSEWICFGCEDGTVYKFVRMNVAGVVMAPLTEIEFE